ncbi:hypothetical protein F4801DRAFT_201930 [Xylaria longipes]|nr:hypothetical protein F4801DRAFT_201930 [Xylaria longipes]
MFIQLPRWTSGHFRTSQRKGWRRLACRCTYPVALLLAATSPTQTLGGLSKTNSIDFLVLVRVSTTDNRTRGALYTRVVPASTPTVALPRPRPHLRRRLRLHPLHTCSASSASPPPALRNRALVVVAPHRSRPGVVIATSNSIVIALRRKERQCPAHPNP